MGALPRMNTWYSTGAHAVDATPAVWEQSSLFDLFCLSHIISTLRFGQETSGCECNKLKFIMLFMNAGCYNQSRLYIKHENLFLPLIACFNSLHLICFKRLSEITFLGGTLKAENILLDDLPWSPPSAPKFVMPKCQERSQQRKYLNSTMQIFMIMKNHCILELSYMSQ